MGLSKVSIYDRTVSRLGTPTRVSNFITSIRPTSRKTRRCDPPLYQTFTPQDRMVVKLRSQTFVSNFSMATKPRRPLTNRIDPELHTKDRNANKLLLHSRDDVELGKARRLSFLLPQHRNGPRTFTNYHVRAKRPRGL